MTAQAETDATQNLRTGNCLACEDPAKSRKKHVCPGMRIRFVLRGVTPLVSNRFEHQNTGCIYYGRASRALASQAETRRIRTSQVKSKPMKGKD